MTDPHEIRVDEESKLTLHGLLQYYAPWKNLNQMVQMVLQERSIIFYFAAVPFAAQTFHIEPLHLELFTYMLIPVCTAQGGGGSFKDRIPIGAVRC